MVFSSDRRKIPQIVANLLGEMLTEPTRVSEYLACLADQAAIKRDIFLRFFLDAIFSTNKV